MAEKRGPGRPKKVKEPEAKAELTPVPAKEREVFRAIGIVYGPDLSTKVRTLELDVNTNELVSVVEESSHEGKGEAFEQFKIKAVDNNILRVR